MKIRVISYINTENLKEATPDRIIKIKGNKFCSKCNRKLIEYGFYDEGDDIKKINCLSCLYEFMTSTNIFEVNKGDFEQFVNDYKKYLILENL